MSGFPLDRSFTPRMSERLLQFAAEFKVDNKLVPWDELISYPPHLLELAAALYRQGWPSRTWEEVREELLRLHARWKKKVPTFKTEKAMRWAESNPYSWVEESEDEDDIFMPPSSKGKGATSSKSKGAASSKGRGAASSKSKGAASSKGKGAASTDAGGCVDGR